VIDERQFFRSLGTRIKQLRRNHGYTQEDMIGYGFSARHWQQIEAGRPIYDTDSSSNLQNLWGQGG
jgi:transcriptional regulator with XRE-family HTH domain